MRLVWDGVLAWVAGRLSGLFGAGYQQSPRRILFPAEPATFISLADHDGSDVQWLRDMKKGGRVLLVWCGGSERAGALPAEFGDAFVYLGALWLGRARDDAGLLPSIVPPAPAPEASAQEFGVAPPSVRARVYRQGTGRELAVYVNDQFVTRHFGSAVHRVMGVLVRELRATEAGGRPEPLTGAKIAQLIGDPEVGTTEVTTALGRLTAKQLPKVLPQRWSPAEREAALMKSAQGWYLNPMFWEVDE